MKMSRIFQIEFSRGGRFSARLLEEEAPETCQQFWEALPFDGKVFHGSFNGFTFGFYVEFKVGKVENPHVTGGQAGDLFLNTYANKLLFKGKELKEEVYLPYAKGGIFWNYGGPAPCNHFAKIEGNMEELYRIGRRIHENGAEMIHLSKL
jgi:hypothetical protein